MKTAIKNESKIDFGHEISVFFIYFMAVICTLIGVWSFACIIGGICCAGGIISFIKAMFIATFMV